MFFRVNSLRVRSVIRCVPADLLSKITVIGLLLSKEEPRDVQT